MRKCKNCRHYRTEKNWYTPKHYPCDSCIDRETNFEPYPEGKMTFDPRKPVFVPSKSLIFNQKEYRKMAEDFKKNRGIAAS